MNALQSGTRAFQPKKIQENVSLLIKLKSTNSGTFEGKKFYLKKSLTPVLHQAIQLWDIETDDNSSHRWKREPGSKSWWQKCLNEFEYYCIMYNFLSQNLDFTFHSTCTLFCAQANAA